MKFLFSENGWDDYLHWQQANPKLLRKINTPLKDIARTPFDGIGKPEPMKHNLTNYWSRRIDDEHRLVYRIEGDAVHIIQCRFHYSR
ncbi:MAG: Txe/YoeB family addiction module toxin [Verrucomicrobia bacterium]|nr:Txe/YoeB family addiction module toxin [Verrucomicrobiota bacterium]